MSRCRFLRSLICAVLVFAATQQKSEACTTRWGDKGAAVEYGSLEVRLEKRLFKPKWEFRKPCTAVEAEVALAARRAPAARKALEQPDVVCEDATGVEGDTGQYGWKESILGDDNQVPDGTRRVPQKSCMLCSNYAEIRVAQYDDVDDRANELEIDSVQLGYRHYFVPKHERMATSLTAAVGAYDLDQSELGQGGTNVGWSLGGSLQVALTPSCTPDPESRLKSAWLDAVASVAYHEVETAGRNLDFVDIRAGLRFTFSSKSDRERGEEVCPGKKSKW